jgi:hypothetical protein
MMGRSWAGSILCFTLPLTNRLHFLICSIPLSTSFTFTHLLHSIICICSPTALLHNPIIRICYSDALHRGPIIRIRSSALFHRNPMIFIYSSDAPFRNPNIHICSLVTFHRKPIIRICSCCLPSKPVIRICSFDALHHFASPASDPRNPCVHHFASPASDPRTPCPVSTISLPLPLILAQCMSTFSIDMPPSGPLNLLSRRPLPFHPLLLLNLILPC